jgi:hypothetical protein
MIEEKRENHGCGGLCFVRWEKESGRWFRSDKELLQLFQATQSKVSRRPEANFSDKESAVLCSHFPCFFDI